MEKFVLPKVVQLIKVLLSKLVAIAILFLGSDSIGYTFVLFLFEIFACILLGILAHRNVGFQPNKMPKEQLREIFIFTSYLFVMAIVSQLYWQIDKLLLGMLIGTTTVAIYSAAMNIQNILRNVSSSLKELLIPKATRISPYDDQSSEKITYFMSKSGRVIFLVYGLMLAGITVLGDKFIYLWIGSEYSAAVPIMMILGYSALLPTVLIPGEEVCKTYNRHGPLTLIYLLIAILNVILTIVFVKKWGMTGAAVSTAIGIIVGNVIIAVGYYYHCFRIKIFQLFFSLFQGILPTFLITIAIGLLVSHWLPHNSWSVFLLQALIISAIYGLTAWVIGLNHEEKDLIKGIILRLRRSHSLPE